jgi:hypothetical protein
MSFQAHELRQEAERELRQRMRVYPRLVQAGRMSAQAAERQIAMQTEIIAILAEREQAERLI